MMKNYIIKKGEKEYAIIEIEFYLYSPSHQDFITYPRDIEAGRWFFHQSGVDLTFNTIKTEEKTNEKGEKYLDFSECVFGGILIRGLYDIKKKVYIFGPYNCVNELWDDFNAFDESISEYPILKKSETQNDGTIVKFKRHIKIDKEKQVKKVYEWAERIGYNIDSKEHQDVINKYKEELFTQYNDNYLYRFFNIIDGNNTWDAIKHLTIAEKDDLKKLNQG